MEDTTGGHPAAAGDGVAFGHGGTPGIGHMGHVVLFALGAIAASRAGLPEELFSPASVARGHRSNLGGLCYDAVRVSGSTFSRRHEPH